MISGMFSIVYQAIGIKILPRMMINYTSPVLHSQIYIGAVNWLLFLAVILMILTFRSSANLASAYGLAEAGAITISAILIAMTLISRRHLGKALIALGLILLDGLFLASTFTKIPHGAYLALAMSSIVFFIIIVFVRGQNRIESALPRILETLRDLPLGVAEDDPRLALPFGLGLHRHRVLELERDHDVPDLDREDVDPPPFYPVLDGLLELVIDGLPPGEHLREDHLPDDIAEDCLCSEQDRFTVLLHLQGRTLDIVHLPEEHRVNIHRHRVLREGLLRVERGRDDPEIDDVRDGVEERNQDDETRTPYPDESSQKQDHDAFPCFTIRMLSAIRIRKIASITRIMIVVVVSVCLPP